MAGAKFGQPAYARYQQPIPSPAPLDLVWFDSQAPGSSSRDLDLDKYFRGVEVATFRSAWNDRDAVFVGFKAGDNKANHSNLDLGTFVLDALGTRWALDLGADNYNMPGYFGKQRWTYYRMRAEGHSVLAINPGMEPDQDPAAAAKIVRFQSNPQRAFAVADLTPAYAKNAEKVLRGVALVDRKQVLVQDEIRSANASKVWWFMHTPLAALNLRPNDGHVDPGNGPPSARILSPPGATFSIMDAQPLATFAPANGTSEEPRHPQIGLEFGDAAIVRLAVLPCRCAKGKRCRNFNRRSCRWQNGRCHYEIKASRPFVVHP